MKIELTCSICEAVLRVDAEHAGKQLRCPNCQGLTQIPVAETGGNHEYRQGFDGQPQGFEPHEKPQTDWQSSASPYATPQAAPPHAAPMNIGAASAHSSNDTLGLVLGIIGIVLNLSCGCFSCFSPILVLANIYGLYLGLNTDGPLRTGIIVVNAIALALGGLMTLVVFGSLVIN